MKNLANAIREAENSLGSYKKSVYSHEKEARIMIRRSIVAKKIGVSDEVKGGGYRSLVNVG